VQTRHAERACDAVQTLSFRDDEFDYSSDRARFDDVSAAYRQIVASKRVDPLDMRLQSGWWGEPGRTARSQSSAGIHTHTHTPPRHIYSAADRAAEDCDERVCLSFCVFVYPQSYLRNYMSDLTRLFANVTYGRGSLLVWRRINTLHTSGCIDDVIFAHKLGLLDVAARLRQ